MLRSLLFVVGLAGALRATAAVEAPAAVVSRSGDRSVVLHWPRSADTNVAGYRVYRASSAGGPFAAQQKGMLATPGFCDLEVTNESTNFYRVTATTLGKTESPPSAIVPAASRPF